MGLPDAPFQATDKALSTTDTAFLLTGEASTLRFCRPPAIVIVGPKKFFVGGQVAWRS